MVSVSVCACVCVWYATYKLSIFGMFANESKSVKCEFFLKIDNFKNIIDRCIISFLWLAPV